jgi:anaerobic ribonucleoside-triphosphate reductase
MYQVVKRDGSIAEFRMERIRDAIQKAFVACNKHDHPSVTDFLALKTVSHFEPKIKNELISVEDIQDSVEEVLIQAGYADVAKAYILYRKQHEKMRDIKGTFLDYKKLVNSYVNVTDWRVKENSTVTYSVGGLILSNSGAITANYWLSEVYDDEIANAHRNADIHLHDLSMLTGYCAGWSLKQLIQEGLGGIPGKITSAPASHLSTLCNQIVNFLGIMQNEWAGAQAFSSFDTYLAPFVKVDNLSYKEVKQCIQSFVYGVNTPSRWGCVNSDTEVLSVNGFKKYNELKEGDLIYTWNNGELQLNPVRKVIIKPYTGKLHSYSSGRYDQTVTPNHRMLVKKHNVDEYNIKLSEEIFNAKTPYALPTKFSSSSIKGIGLSDDEIRLAAIIYTDGSVDMRDGKAHKATVYKSPKRYGNEMICEIAEKLGLEFTESKKQGEFGSVNQYTFYGDAARRIIELVGSKTNINSIFLGMNQHQAEIFLNTWATFDGNVQKMVLQCDNPQIADEIQQIAVLAGYTSYRMERRKTQYIKLRKTKCVYPHKREEVDYDGIVWCPNVENGTAVFRYKGNVYISGQTQAPFSNITLDWTVPADLAELNCIVGGKETDFKYKDCKAEMDMINKAFIEIMIEGDANGRGFQYPIPTYSITKDFDWSETENNKLLFEMTSKYGTPYFSNYVNSDMEPSEIRSMCCRLRLDLRELRKKSGGFFGSGESTGSVGVVTINLPRIAYLAKDEKDFYDRLDKMLDIAARSLKVKRTTISKLLDEGLYPYTKRYLGTFENHFSTIGIIGMNEAGLNAKWLRADLTDPKTQIFAKDVLNHIRTRLSDYQEMYGDLYNLEATPAESTSYRLAKHDVKRYPDIITASKETPYYTNSTHLPVGYTEDMFTALDIQDELQTLYNSGTVFHAFLGEKLPDWKASMKLVRTISENYKLPYYTISPVYSVCKNHGYITGEVYKCPECGEKTEVYSRITGYYRPVQNWNDGKAQEFKDRKMYVPKSVSNSKEGPCAECEVTESIKTDNNNTEIALPVGNYLFKTETCPNCKIAESKLDKASIPYVKMIANENVDLVKSLGIKQAPTLVVVGEATVDKFVGTSQIIQFIADNK